MCVCTPAAWRSQVCVSQWAAVDFGGVSAMERNDAVLAGYMDVSGRWAITLSLSAYI